LYFTKDACGKSWPALLLRTTFEKVVLDWECKKSIKPSWGTLFITCNYFLTIIMRGGSEHRKHAREIVFKFTEYSKCVLSNCSELTWVSQIDLSMENIDSCSWQVDIVVDSCQLRYHADVRYMVNDIAQKSQ